MVVLRCTRPLLARLRPTKDFASEPSTTRLGDWYGTLTRFGRRQVLIFISERSRLPVLLPAGDATRLHDALLIAIADALTIVGVPDAAIDRERVFMSEIRLGRAQDRSLIGSLNEFARLGRAHLEVTPNDPPNVIGRELADVPLILPFKGDCARAVTRRVFGLD